MYICSVIKNKKDMKTINFPKDFKKQEHSLIKNATHWTLHDTKGDVVISIVGGASGLYGDGINTFEYYDFKEDNPRGYLSIIEINELLSKYTF